LSEQPEHARGEALGLAQGEVEDEPQISTGSIAASEYRA
jgi:hypothetical protein